MTLILNTKNQETLIKQQEKAEEINKLRETLENRGKFIDWMIERHLDIVKDYLGFND